MSGIFSHIEYYLYKWANTLRAGEWWNAKLPLLIAFYLAYLPVEQQSLGALLPRFSALLLWIIAAAGFGHFLNDCCDIQQDAKAGKANSAASRTPGKRAAILIILSAASLLPWIIFREYVILILSFCHLLSFVFYSVPPLRVKERGYLSVASDALYAYILPVAITALFAGLQDVFSLALALLWALFSGLRAIIQHLLADRKNDRISGSNNVVNVVGIAPNILLINISALLEVAAFTLLLFRLPYAGTFLAILYLCFTAFSLFKVTRYGIIFHLRKQLRSGSFQLNAFYEDWFPVLLLAICIMRNTDFVLLAIVYLALFRSSLFMHILHILARFLLWAKDTIVAVVKFLYYGVLVHFFYHGFIKGFLLYGAVQLYHHVVLRFLYFLKTVISLAVNYSIYYYRRLVLKQDDRTARKMTEEQYANFLLSKKEKKKNPVSELKHASETNPASEKPAENPKPACAEGPLLEENEIVHGLWIGDTLSHLEMLTIHSFINCGHSFHLWTYGKISNALPAGATLRDANEIIPEEKVFRYKYANKFGHGKGSVSGFSDIFRYKLLYEKGGWWVDMDVTCLQPLNFTEPYFFRKHHDLRMVGNVMKCPPGSELMLSCYNEASREITATNTDWHKPIEILNKYVFAYGLENYIYEGLSNEDKWDQIKPFIRKKKPFPEAFFFVHWMNEEWRSRNIDKNDMRYRSTLGELLFRYGLMPRPVKNFYYFTNDLRHLVWLRLYEHSR